MAKGNWSGGAASASIIDADGNRDLLIIQMTTAGACALAFGEAAVAGQGCQMWEIGDTWTVRGDKARLAVYQIGATAAGTWQGAVDGEFVAGPNPSP
jgi:hypothetical protein